MEILENTPSSTFQFNLFMSFLASLSLTLTSFSGFEEFIILSMKNLVPSPLFLVFTDTNVPIGIKSRVQILFIPTSFSHTPCIGKYLSYDYDYK